MTRLVDIFRVRVRIQSLVCLAVTLAVFTQPAAAGDFVQIVHGKDAPAIEVYAANELADLLKRAYADVTIQVDDHATRRSAVTVCVGSPTTNELTRVLFKDWPKVSDQGIVIRSQENTRFHAVGGGSPAATLWAVYELGHRMGFRFLPRGDIDPLEKKSSVDFSDADTVLEPQLRSRTWQTLGDLAIGSSSWGVDEHRRLLKQLARMKYNRLSLRVSPWQPFVEYEFGGVKKTTALHWFGEEFRVDGDAVGKKVFRGKTVFENPDFAGIQTSAERHAAGRKYIQEIMDAAHDLGMTVGVSIAPLEFPREFQAALPGSEVASDSRGLTVTAGADSFGDETLRRLVTTKIRACLDTWPGLDELILRLPDDGQGSALTLLAELLDDDSLVKRPDGKPVEVVIEAVNPATGRSVPEGTATLISIGDTAPRAADNRRRLESVPAETYASRLIMTLADDNAGLLPQSSLQSLETLTRDIKKLGWDGFSARCRIPAELDSSVYFLSRASWEEDLTAEACLKELWTSATQNAAAADRLWIAWQNLEKATRLIDENAPGFARPGDGLLMKHYRPEPIPDWWQQVTDACTQYMIELYRAHGAIDGDSKPILFYYAKRGEYVLEYLAAVKAVRDAALAKQSGDTEAALEHLEVALESTYNCINTLSDIARDPSDRGLIAVLNEFGFRPLLAELEELSDM